MTGLPGVPKGPFWMCSLSWIIGAGGGGGTICSHEASKQKPAFLIGGPRCDDERSIREMQPSETDSTRLAAAGFADGGRRLVLRNADDIQTLEKARKQMLPESPQKGRQPSRHLDCSPARPRQIPELHNETTCVSKATDFAVNCYSNGRKPIQS